MSWAEHGLRITGKTAAVSLVVTPPFWIVGLVHPWGVLFLILASISIGVFGLWYGAWAIDHSGSSGSYESAWYGAGKMKNGDSPIYSCRPYWVFGRQFRRRLHVRRLRELERACGLDASVFTEDFQHA